MPDTNQKFIVSLLATMLDNSHLNESPECIRLEKLMEKYENQLINFKNKDLFENYKSAILDHEILFYSYGVLDAFKHVLELIDTPAKNLIADMDVILNNAE